jgi:DNA-binding Lrp family transcriptional regulator
MALVANRWNPSPPLPAAPAPQVEEGADGFPGVDGLDVRILRAMGVLPYQHPGDGTDALKAGRIAAQVGVTAETVRERVQRLERLGIIAGYEVVPNLRHLGLEASAYLYVPADEARRDRLRDAVRTVEGVLELTYFVGAAVCVDLCFGTADQKDRRLRALSEATGDAQPAPFFGWALPPVERPLTPLDWRILHALRHDARRPLAEVAQGLGVAYRTVKRHHDRMAREGSFCVRPVLNPAKDEGLVPAGLLFFFAPDAAPDLPARILAAFPDEYVFGSHLRSQSAGNYDLLVFGRSAAHVEEMRRRGAALPGVRKVDALVLADVLSCSGWLDELVAARAQAPVSKAAAVAPLA